MNDIHRVVDSLAELEGEPADIGAESLAAKGQPGGYASLDENGYVPASQLPTYDYLDGGSLGE